MMKKRILILVSFVFFGLLLVACDNNGGNDTADNNATDSTVATEAGNGAPETNDEEPITLNIIGPGVFASVTENGAIDLVSGVQRPGYGEVIARWNELHPHVTLNIDALPWDNWQASLQTAALAGDVDVLVHAASIPDIVEPLTGFLAADPSVNDAVSTLAWRRIADGGAFQSLTALGMSVAVNPVVVVVDMQIFEEWGVELPDVNWTLDDMLAVAEATTGINPETGAQNYGISLLPNNNVQQNFIWAARAMDAQSISFGDSLLDSEINFNNPAVHQTLDFINALYQFASPDYIEGFDLEFTATENNNIAMYLNQSAFEEYNAIAAAGLTDRFMFLPLPNIEGGVNEGRTSSHMGDWNMTIARNSENQDWAWEFIRFMVEDPFVQDWLVRVHQFPNNIAGLDAVRGSMSSQYFAAIEHILTHQADNFSVQTSEWYDSTTLPIIPSAVQLALNEMFRNTMNAEEAAEAIQEAVDNHLDSLR